jgi:hypothetical protein
VFRQPFDGIEIGGNQSQIRRNACSAKIGKILNAAKAADEIFAEGFVARTSNI